jgi:hypothetical protein
MILLAPISLTHPCLQGLEQYCVEGATWTYNGVERDRKTLTQGGYSNKIVVDDNYVLRIPDNLPTDGAAPLLCAGITLYSPLMHWKAGPGKNVGIIGLGGLGHMVDKEIKEKKDKIRSTQKYYRLLVSKDKLLVKTVAEALKLLGIDDVKEKGGADEEDLIFQFKYVSEFKSGVIEIHGTDRNITLKKLAQCHKWVENHLMEVNENIVKGIVISNQSIHR